MRAGWSLNETTGPDTVRQAIRRKPEVFTKRSKGLYALAKRGKKHTKGKSDAK